MIPLLESDVCLSPRSAAHHNAARVQAKRRSNASVSRRSEAPGYNARTMRSAGTHALRINRRQAIGCAAWLATTAAGARAESLNVFTVRPPDTKTADDAVEEALKQLLRAGGGTLYFPRGSYEL